MKTEPYWAFLLVAWLVAVSTSANLFASESTRDSFREILNLAEIDEAKLIQLGNGDPPTDADLSLVLSLFERLQQFRSLQAVEPIASAAPAQWRASDGQKAVGEIFELRGQITSVTAMKLTANLARLHGASQLYRSVFRFADTDAQDTGSVTVLSRKIPKTWNDKASLNEPVVVRGVLAYAREAAGNRPDVVVADHIGWYPRQGAPTGQLMLVRQGMDVALLDEVRHRKPFVKPTISREGEAFYAALSSLRMAKLSELSRLAKKNVERVAARWRDREPALESDLRRQREQLAKTQSDGEQKRSSRSLRRAKLQRDLATTIARQAKQGQSSVATMFLQPEREVGEFFYFSGTARRAVWIAAEEQENLEGYYEVEVFPAESRLLDNRPVVCCMCELPESFPTGDEIREGVRIVGVFFKSWRYRARDYVDESGETEVQQQLYTPVLLGKQLIWLNRDVKNSSGWALWGGLGFLGVLAAVWIGLVWLSGHDRRARSRLRRHETIDL
ncbi:MAG: hypothetical protein AAGD11_17725 [Planctomycetota bacterium]